MMAASDQKRGPWTRHKWLGLGLGVAALLGTVAFLGPAIFPVVDSETSEPPAPDFARQALIESGRLVLPPVAEGPATIHFNVTNLGQENNLFIREVAIEHTGAAETFDTVGPDMRRLANVPINPGETVNFGTQERQVVLSDYDSNVVPGSTLNMRLTFSNGETATVPLTVQSSVSQDGEIPGEAPGSVSEPPS